MKVPSQMLNEGSNPSLDQRQDSLEVKQACDGRGFESRLYLPYGLDNVAQLVRASLFYSEVLDSKSRNKLVIL